MLTSQRTTTRKIQKPTYNRHPLQIMDSKRDVLIEMARKLKRENPDFSADELRKALVETMQKGQKYRGTGCVAHPYPISQFILLWRIVSGVKKRQKERNGPLIDDVIAEVKAEWERGKVIN